VSKTHQLKEYVKYRRKARGMHGVHSPFAYELSENLLKQKAAPGNLVLATSRHRKLVNKIISYFQCRHILWLTNKDGETETYISIGQEEQGGIQLRTERFNFDQFATYPPPDLYLIDLENPEDWMQAWQKYKPYIGPNDVFLITSVHQSREHTGAWDQIHMDDAVRLSTDLFKVGLLFFREEFKEKQHFVLKTKS
jgi:hypothetical protein